MVQSPLKLITVNEFITQYGDSDRYELIDGELIEIEPTEPHEQVSSLIGRKLNVEIDQTIGNKHSLSSRCDCIRPNPTNQ